MKVNEHRRAHVLDNTRYDIIRGVAVLGATRGPMFRKSRPFFRQDHQR